MASHLEIKFLRQPEVFFAFKVWIKMDCEMGMDISPSRFRPIADLGELIGGYCHRVKSSKDIFEEQAHSGLLQRATIDVGLNLFHLGKYEQAYPFGQRGLALFEDLVPWSQIDYARFVQSWVSLGVGTTSDAERSDR
ncbi:hypothetical protein ACFLXI_09220 [Chloroflexota bacterium]